VFKKLVSECKNGIMAGCSTKWTKSRYLSSVDMDRNAAFGNKVTTATTIVGVVN
jgi:hypothetical protein